jgi:HSP20 family protein
VVAEVPGINKEDISVTVDKGMITISGEKASMKEEQETAYYLKETSVGSFSRSFQLPGEVDGTKVDANYKDGVLTVTMPKQEESKGKKIEIN